MAFLSGTHASPGGRLLPLPRPASRRHGEAHHAPRGAAEAAEEGAPRGGASLAAAPADLTLRWRRMFMRPSLLRTPPSVCCRRSARTSLTRRRRSCFARSGGARPTCRRWRRPSSHATSSSSGYGTAAGPGSLSRLRPCSLPAVQPQLMFYRPLFPRRRERRRAELGASVRGKLRPPFVSLLHVRHFCHATGRRCSSLLCCPFLRAHLPPNRRHAGRLDDKAGCPIYSPPCKK